MSMPGRTWAKRCNRMKVKGEKMKRKFILPGMMVMAVLLFLVLLAAGCGGESPSATVQGFVNDLNNRNFESIYESSGSSIKGATTKEEFISALESVWVKGSQLEDFEILSEQIDGDTATVTYKVRMVVPNVESDEEASEQSVNLVKEDGEWKLN